MGVVVEILHSTQRVRREIQKNPRTRCVLARSVGIIITTYYYYYYYLYYYRGRTHVIIMDSLLVYYTMYAKSVGPVVVKMKLKNEIKTQVI